jgi:surface antigen
MGELPEATAVANQADSVNAELAMAPSSANIVAKTQVVSTAFNSRQDIKTYTTVAGDTIPSIAAKFNVTSDSVRWSNNINTDAVAVNQKLVIPPVNGIVYTVVAGDTADSLAAKFNANKDKLIAFNDAEVAGFQPGEQILIPDGTKAAPVAAATVSRSTTTSFPWGGSAPIYGYNGYDYGFCTWYVASRISVPTNWGNANTWDNLAPLSGWTVSTTPTPGAIAQTDRGGEGHVAIVEAVSPDGTQIKYSDMNGLAGFGRVGYSDWAPVSTFMHYITH